jgi:hypothetical protein
MISIRLPVEYRSGCGGLFGFPGDAGMAWVYVASLDMEDCIIHDALDRSRALGHLAVFIIEEAKDPVWRRYHPASLH